ncbi:MAG: FAD-dependent oxidoreductase [Thermodesulfobacteriota bacterium]
MKRYLIIGNGVAGTTAAEAIRRHDEQGEITILTDEELPFYFRIRLNDYISGDIDQKTLIVRSSQWYAEKNIRLLTGVKVTGADPEQRWVVTDCRGKFSYDLLLVATGSRSFVPPIKGVESEGVFTLRTAADAEQISDYARRCEQVLLIGGGLLGLESGKALRKLGKKVLVVEFFPWLLPRQLDERGAARLQKLLEDMGFSFRLGVTVREISGRPGVAGVVLNTGETLAADMVIISAGVRPDLAVAGQLGLACGHGIIVDETLRTSRPEVFAAGDVAEFSGTLYGIWPAAMEQGRIAGSNMAGVHQSYHGSVMANKLKVAGIDLASAGEIDPENRFAARIRETDSVYRKIVLEEDRIIGCILLGDTTDFSVLTRAIGEKTTIKDLPEALK